MVRSFVRAVMWSSGALDSFSSLWAAIMLCTSKHCQYNENVLYFESNNIQVELI